MSRILCLRLPQWPLVRLRVATLRASGARESGSLPSGERPIVLFERDPRRGARISAASRSAQEQGVRLGMPVTEAAALLRGQGPRRTLDAPSASGNRQPPLVFPHDRGADRRALEELAAWCERFSPLVGLEEAEHPHSLLLEIGGTAPRLGGEARLLALVRRGLLELGYAAHLAVADTVGAAWALAWQQEREGERAAPQGSIRSPVLGEGVSGPDRCEPLPSAAGAASHIAPLPVAALRLPAATLALLEELGLTTIGQLLAIPRSALAARFGEPDPAAARLSLPTSQQRPASSSSSSSAGARGRDVPLTIRLDQALGLIAEPLVPHRPLPEIEERWSGEHPLGRQEIVLAALAPLIERATRELRSRRRGAAQLECRLDLEQGGPATLPIGLYRPTASASHLAELLAMQLATRVLPSGVTGICLKVITTSPLEEEQGELFPDAARDGARRRAALIDRLSSRLGAAAVLAARTQGDPLPERGVKLCPQVELARSPRLPESPPPRRKSARTRPRGYRPPPAETSASPAASAARRSAEEGRLSVEQRRVTSPAWLDAAAPLSLFAPDQMAGEQVVRESRVPAAAFHRPLFLHPPEPIEVLAIAPHGPPLQFVWRGGQHRVTRSWGPERIETGWWRGRSIRRDYYRVETEGGGWFWLFRQLDTRQWKLQGRFE